MAKPICDGLVVLELGTSKTNAMAGMILADNGARVIKVEPPGGDPIRTTFPTAFLVWNRGKESVVLDLRTEAGRAEARRIAERADVLIESFGRGAAERFGLGYEALRAANPALVYCSIKGFATKGALGALPGYDGLVMAKSGAIRPSTFRAGPGFTNLQEPSNGASQLAVQGILAALIVRDRTGRGQRVDTSLHQGLMPYDLSGMIGWHLANVRPDLAPPRPTSGLAAMSAGGGGSLISERLCTKDGRWVSFMSILPHQFKAYIRALGLERLWDEPEFAAMAPVFPDAAVAERYRDVLLARFRERTWAEWEPVLLADKDVVFELIRSSEEALDHPQVRHNGGWVELDDPRVGRMRQVGPIAAFSDAPAVVRGAAPELGQHGDLSLAGRTLPKDTGATDPAHPLAGVTVIEFAAFYAATFGATLLADLGARVIKVEDLAGDPWRAGGTAAVKAVEGKESLALNLRAAEGKEIFRKVVAQADVFVYGFRPASAKGMGLDYETLKALNPKLVYVFAGGYDASVPYADRAMYGNTTGPMVGGVHRTSGRWLDPALADGLDVPALKTLAKRIVGGGGGDPESALGRATTILLALLDQRRRGAGQYVETSMVHMNCYAHADDFNSYAGKPPMALPDREADGLGPLYRLYETKSGWVFLAAPREHDRRVLSAAMELPELTDADTLARALAERFATKTAAEWEALLATRGVGCVEVYAGTAADFNCATPEVREAGLVAEARHSRFDTYLRHGPNVILSAAPARLDAGSETGEHSAALLRELGYSEEDIRRFEDAKVIGVWRPEARAKELATA